MTHGELVLYESRGPQLWQPGCAAIGVLVGGAAIATGQLGGIVLVVIFGLFLAVSVAWYRQRPDRLTIDDAGFTVARGALTVRCPWSDVVRASIVRDRGRPWMHIELRSDSRVNYPWRKALPGSLRWTAATLPASYGMEVDELAALFEKRRQAAAQERVAPQDHPDPSLPAGYTTRTTEGGLAIVRPSVTLSCATVFVGLWTVLWDVVTVGMIVGAGRDGFELNEVVLLGIAAAVGVGVTVVGLRAILIRRSWLLSDGVVEERTALRGVGDISRRPYVDVQRIEMRTGMWVTGAGRTDELVLWTTSRPSPITLHPPVENAPGGVRALGNLFAAQTRRPFTTVEQRIPEPKPPGD
ncbi:MAG: PH domain-containing protein [Chloroflexi bacterium]|nr:MAG: PH domain-containing protein [Chloroflexota bacterium]